MFDRAILETDNFLNISMGAKALYFLLGMEADDEGFVSPNRVLRIYGGEMGDLKNLIDTKLVIPFQSGVIVITDWKKNNWLDNRRIKPTEYQIEKTLLNTTPEGKYELKEDGLASAKRSLSNGGARVEESRVEESRVDKATTSLPGDRSLYMKERKEENKNKVFSHYSDGKNCCIKCGVSDVDLLAVDHINGNGRQHLKENNLSGGVALYAWLVRNNYPSGFQILCYNCNIKKYREETESVASSKSTKKKKVQFTTDGAKILKLFESIDPINKTYYANKTERAACEFLFNEYGLQKVTEVVDILPVTNKRPRFEFPFVNTPDKLMKNWTKIFDGIQALKNKKVENKNKYPTI